MFKITWDKNTGGVQLHSRIVDGTLGTSPRPVFWEELDLLKLNELGWSYPHCDEPLLWAINKQYWYRGELMFEAKGANIYDPATIVFQPGKEKAKLKPVDVAAMLERNKEYMFLLESEALEFIRETFTQYAGANRSVERVAANQLDFERMAQQLEAKQKKKMAIVKEDCDSFDIMPLEAAEQQGKRVYQTTKIDRFIASFSGGKDSQVVLDLCTRAIPSNEFEVIYSDTGYELPTSLALYEQVQQHYKSLFPDLRFSIARNHESVLNYWDKIGTPSDSHRWCCSIMKTAPLYRMLKIEGSNKQAKVLTFDGVRAEESTKRDNYARFGKGKHTLVYNAHPILHWNTSEIFLYLFEHSLTINPVYRIGKARVGCIICPFSTSWDDMIAQTCFPTELHPFTDRLQRWSKKLKILGKEDFIKSRNWKIKAIGDTPLSKIHVSFTERGSNFVAIVDNSRFSIHDWLPSLCEYSIFCEDDIETGTIKFNKKLYSFQIEYNNEQYKLTIFDAIDPKLIYGIRRVIYKSAYCVQCEVCEVDCPTGALSIVPKIKIDKEKCIHCHKCLISHDQGCISADCIRMIKNMNNNMNVKIQGYKTFGFRQEWLDEYLIDPDYFWTSNSLGTAQVDGFKAWLKDADIINSKNQITPIGQIIQQIKDDEINLVWEIIATNLSYKSFILNWFSNNINIGQVYNKKLLETKIIEQGFTASSTTVANAVAAFVQTCEYSPIGDTLNYLSSVEDKNYQREAYGEITPAGLAYSLYKYAEKKGVHSLRVADFYAGDNQNGPAKVLGITKMVFVNTLKALNSLPNRVLIAELNMGLDSITLRDDLTPISCLQSLIK